MVKNLPANAGATGDVGLIPGSGRSPGEGNGNLLQNSCLENPMDRGAWWDTVHVDIKRVRPDLVTKQQQISKLEDHYVKDLHLKFQFPLTKGGYKCFCSHQLQQKRFSVLYSLLPNNSQETLNIRSMNLGWISSSLSPSRCLALDKFPLSELMIPFSSVQFSHSIVSDTLRPHESQHLFIVWHVYKICEVLSIPVTWITLHCVIHKEFVNWVPFFFN